MAGDLEVTSNSVKGRIRRATIACDHCRMKKVRCDGPYVTDGPCSICEVSGVGCTYLKVAKKRGPAKEYVITLETRLAKIESFLRQHRPDIDIPKELKTDKSLRQEENKVELSVMSNSTELKIITPESPQIDDDTDSSDYENTLIDVAKDTQDPTFDDGHTTFFGKSSPVGLFRQVMGMKNEYSGIGGRGGHSFIKQSGFRRPEYWQPIPLVTINFDNPEFNYQYPDSELLPRLIEFYFTEVNIYFPIFHRPTFERAILDGVHLRDESFGALLLLVCAIACNQSKHSALDSGVYWFHQVRMNRRSILGPVRLYQVQLTLLLAVYTWMAFPQDGPWIFLGIGIRLCQDVGAHRRKLYGATPTVEGEQWKRIFWALLLFDRLLSCCFGQQSTLRDEDFDLDYPTECDDEYWSHSDPEKAFKQPLGKPCSVSYFILALRQSHILGRALRTLYSNTKSKVLLNIVGPEKDKAIVAELDSALNKWVDSIPTYLNWDPDREDSVFARQSAHLWINYYHLQILIHRPFITSARKLSRSSGPSLAICTNAARLCGNAIEALRLRYGGMTIYLTFQTATSAIMLLVNRWESMRTGTAVDHEKDMAAFTRCMDAVKEMAKTFVPAFHIGNAIDSLATAGESPGRFPSHFFTMIRRKISYEGSSQNDEPRVGENVNGETDSTLFPRVVPGRNSLDGRLPKETLHSCESFSALKLSPEDLVGPLQQQYLPHMSSSPDPPLPIGVPSVVPYSWTRLLGSPPDLATYEVDMLNLDSIFTAEPQEDSVSSIDSALTQMEDLEALKSDPVTDSLSLGMRNDLSEMSDADLFTPMSATPATLFWKDWDNYIHGLMYETPVMQGASVTDPQL